MMEQWVYSQSLLDYIWFLATTDIFAKMGERLINKVVFMSFESFRLGYRLRVSLQAGLQLTYIRKRESWIRLFWSLSYRKINI